MRKDESDGRFEEECKQRGWVGRMRVPWWSVVEKRRMDGWRGFCEMAEKERTNRSSSGVNLLNTLGTVVPRERIYTKYSTLTQVVNARSQGSLKPNKQPTITNAVESMSCMLVVRDYCWMCVGR